MGLADNSHGEWLLHEENYTWQYVMCNARVTMATTNPHRGHTRQDAVNSSTGELLAMPTFMRHDDQGHSTLKHHESVLGLKWVCILRRHICNFMEPS